MSVTQIWSALVGVGRHREVVRRDRLIMPAVGRAHSIPAFLPALQTQSAHQSGNPIDAHWLAFGTQGRGHSRTAISLAGGLMHLRNPAFNDQRLASPRRLSGVVPPVVAAA